MLRPDGDVEISFRAFRDAPAECRSGSRSTVVDQLRMLSREDRVLIAAYDMVPLVGAVLSPAGRQVVVPQTPRRNLTAAAGTISWADEEKLELVHNATDETVPEHRLYGHWIPLGGITDIITLAS